MEKIYEIELKAWADDPEGTERRLAGTAQYLGEFRRDDVYWFPKAGCGGLPPSGVRIRREWSRIPEGREAEAVFVTSKAKEVLDGMEVNDEREFRVIPGSAGPEELFRLLDLAPGAAKTKRGKAWLLDGVRAELTQVEGLGWFVELEILAGREDPQTREEARGRLLEALDKAGVSRGRIEERYYTEMLGEIRACPYLCNNDSREKIHER